MSTEMTRHPRVDVADVLRGLSVMAIILLHSIEHFNCFDHPDNSGQPLLLRFADKALWDGMFFLIGGKAYAIFALLFGFSFFIMDDNQRMKGSDFRMRFAWRLLLLFIIGNINAMFFTGEILVLYSLVGFVLVLVCRMPTKALLWLAAICLLQPVCLWQIARAGLDPDYVAALAEESSHWRAAMAAQAGESFWEMAKANLWHGQIASLAWAWNNGRVFQTAALFILGMLIGRQGWFMREKLKNWQAVLLYSLIAFFPLYGISNMLGAWVENPNMLKPLAILFSSLHKFAFMLILVSSIIIAYYSWGKCQRRLNVIIPYGKMSMTNYVTQSIVGAFIFYGWGIGLYDDLGTTTSLMLGACLFFLQYAFCAWWLRERKHGPLEHIWKCLTWIYP